eukprot:TRINITY_DN2598_c0_g3_i3.p1 TRINITY_DN2598_c0_g3~~TRINITY_DN2598_c0_g3_i3.p1  ORF type:complete len:484 (-),score=73.66 TRINITY_DN2598_c0_g3_i3:107-1558(-)
MAASSSSSTSSPSVVVIGAGSAGLYAAYLLRKAGVTSVTVVEASGRLGGRVMQDLGADFVHGSLSNPIVELAKQEGWKLHYLFDISESGKNGNEAMALGDRIYNWGDPVVQDALHVLHDISESAPGLSTDVTMHDALVAKGYRPDTTEYRIIEAAVARTWSATNTILGLKETAREEAEWPNGSDNFILGGGFPEMVEFLAKGVEVRLKWRVRTVDSTQVKGPVRVISDSGEVLPATYVICTAPLPILRDGDIRFAPPLPADKLAALQAVRMGHAVKAACVFSQRFWPESLHLLLTDHPLFGQIWMVGEAGCRPDRPDRQEYVVTAFITGPLAAPLVGGIVTAKTLVQQPRPEDPNHPQSLVVQFCEYLDRLYTPPPTTGGGKGGNGNGNGNGNGVATGSFKHAVVFNWDENPFVRGAYSFPTVGTTQATRAAIARPVGNVLFAGEHTHPYGAGTVHTAMETAAFCVDHILRSNPPSPSSSSKL